MENDENKIFKAYIVGSARVLAAIWVMAVLLWSLRSGSFLSLAFIPIGLMLGLGVLILPLSLSLVFYPLFAAGHRSLSLAGLAAAAMSFIAGAGTAIVQLP
ncbi:MAG: hypothetical protein KC777_01235 [Cyanobacteria bacterium HKST-UBA02]|nr:hypothetical protein [Cyanobacteria bacterium HKST-UBA02]